MLKNTPNNLGNKVVFSREV